MDYGCTRLMVMGKHIGVGQQLPNVITNGQQPP